jgi:ribonuclease Y
MEQSILLIIIIAISLIFGVIIGYYVRQNLAKKRAGSLEAKLQKKVADVKEETATMIKNAEKKSAEIIDKAQKDVDERRREFLKAQQLLLSRESLLATRITDFEEKENDLQKKAEKLKSIKE